MSIFAERWQAREQRRREKKEMDKRNVDILLFVEHVVRELDIACAIKYLLDKRHGVSLEIASIVFDLENTLERWQPQVVALPFCLGANTYGIRRILPVWNDAVYVNLSYEQIFYKINKEYRVPQDTFVREHLLHHAWGDFYAEYLQSHGVPKKHIVINGNPSYTLYRLPYSAYFESRTDLAKRYRLDASKRWVFIPENYKTAFLPEHTLQKYIRLGADESETYQHRDFDLASLREVIQWWVQAARLGTVELIVRPRPVTPKARFMKACLEMGGEIPQHLHIIKDGTVREWGLASDVVVSSYSTTLIEAAVADKPIYILMPIPFPEFLQQEWYDLVPKIESLSAFLQVTTNSELLSPGEPLKAWAERTMMSRGDAIRNLADLLASVHRRKRPIPTPPGIAGIPIPTPEFSLPAKGIRKLLRRARRELAQGRARRGLARVWRRISGRQGGGHEQDEIRTSDVVRRLSKWAEVLE